MAIDLKPEQEQVIGRAIQAGLISSSEDVVEMGVASIRRRLEALHPTSPNLADENWSRELHAWMHGHSSDMPPLPDEAISRESIYGTRGL